MSDLATAGLRRADVPQFTISRVIKAPLARVWKAWTDEAQLGQWWAPKGFTNLGVKLDLRVGGTMHYGLRSPDGVEFYGRFVYHEIVPEKRLVLVLSFADAEGNVVRHPWDSEWPLHLLTTIEFADLGNRTEVTVHWLPVDASGEEAKRFDEARESCKTGWNGTFDNLDALFARNTKE
jgi:uncharacterized protein YndB with AHSA1/START domain